MPNARPIRVAKKIDRRDGILQQVNVAGANYGLGAQEQAGRFFGANAEPVLRELHKLQKRN